MTALIKKHRQGRVARLTLNRPEVLNAINDDMMDQLVKELLELDKNPDIGVIVLTGSEKAFAAGVEIPMMLEKDFQQVYGENMITRNWDMILRVRKPIIAAVAGFALGGGCELAMNCDIIVAADNARFAQPEIKVGTIPGAGGTQRLTRLIGKSKAMYMCLTGHQMSAEDACQAGLVAKVYPLDGFMDSVMQLAEEIANHSLPLTQMIKEVIRQNEDMPLSAGLAFERRMFHASFALDDREEGMRAFVEKRKPKFSHR